MLDKRKDFGTVRGRFGISYYQDGKYFNIREEQVDPSTGDIIPSEPPKESHKVLDAVVPEKVINDAQLVEKDCPEPPPQPKIIGDDVDLESYPYQKIKSLVERAGGVWTNKIEGIKYLRGM